MIFIDIAAMANNGSPLTEDVAHAFRKRGLDIRLTLFADADKFARRGLVRNVQLKNAYDTPATHIYFADADHVYSPDHFDCLMSALKNKYRKAQCLLFSAKQRHTDIGKTDRIIGRQGKGRLWIDDAYKVAMTIPTRNKFGKCIAAGCMQVASLAAVRLRAGGIYVDPIKCLDSHLFRNGQYAKSDKQFRQSMGGCRQIFLPEQVHMDHQRDKESGKHLEYQR